MMTTEIPIHEGLLTGPPSAPQLVGGRCIACGSFHFPPQDNCPQCASLAVERQALSRRGTLWTWTVQGFVPPVPPYAGEVEAFVPFGVGYVELPEGLCVAGRLTVNDPARLRIGMAMELTTETLRVDAQGRAVISYAFRPEQPA